MTQEQINASNLLTFGCLLRATAKAMREQNVTIRRACRVMRMILHRLASENGMELPGDLYQSIIDLAKLDEHMTAAEFADLMQQEGDRAVRDATKMETA